jgi:hypothetical protein
VKKGSGFLLAAVVILGLYFSGCGEQPLVLTGGGPMETTANTVFNKQANGNAAMWLNTQNATTNTRVMFSGKELKPDFQDPQHLTMMVPAELYSTPGKFEIYLFDPASGKKSNSVYFTVK